MTRLISIFWACFFAFSTVAQEPEQSFSLTHLIKMANIYNPALLSRKNEIDIRTEDATIARSALLPNVYFRANAGTIDSLSENSSQNTTGYSIIATETLSYPSFYQLKSSKKQVEAAQQRYKEAQQNLWLQVISAWLVMQETAEGSDVIEVRQKNLSEQLKRAEALLEGGRGTLVDVLQSRASLAAVRAQLARAKNDLEVAEANVKQMTGGKARLAFLDPKRPLPDFLDIDEWLARVAQNSPAQKSFNIELESLQVLLKIAEYAIYPTFSFSAQISHDNNTSGYSETLGVNVQQSLYRGGRIGAEERRVIAQIKQLMEDIRSLKQNEAQETKRLHANSSASLIEINSLKYAKEASEAALEAIKIGYGEGVYLAADVLAAEENLFTIQSQLRQARYAYILDWAMLNSMAGSINLDYVALLNGFFIER